MDSKPDRAGVAAVQTDFSRREFVAASFAVGLAGVGAPATAAGVAVVEREVTIKTPDGICDAAFFHPATGAHPGVLIWPDAFGLRPSMREIHGREGMVGARTDEEVAVFGVRGGDVVGDHTVYLLGPGERLELTHRSSSREMLATGALRAARFLAKQTPGKLYRIADVLG